MCDVSIVIVNYRSEKLICDAVESVVSHTEGVDYEIIVVDNDPSAESRAVLGELSPNVSYKYLEMDDNLGFGMANNEGFRHANGKYLFCLNPDTLLINNAIKILYDYMETHPKCGACGGNLYHADMKEAHSFRRILPGVLWEYSESHRRHPEHILYGRNSKFNRSNHPIKVGYITGADLMLRADVIKETGAFAPEFFMYFEETDLCCRIHKAGYDVVSVPQAKIIHLEGMSMGKEAANARKLGFFADSRVEYYKRNLPLKQAARAYKIHLAYIRKQCAKGGVRGEEAKVLLDCTVKALERYPDLKKLLSL